MSTLADFNVCRPAGWAESDEEVRRLYQRLLERQRQAENWIKTPTAVWITFDKWASRLLGLDESKYEWAKIENELMEQERLYELANDSLAATKQLSDMETGSLSEQPEASMEMMRSTPEINHQSTT